MDNNDTGAPPLPSRNEIDAGAEHGPHLPTQADIFQIIYKMNQVLDLNAKQLLASHVSEQGRETLRSLRESCSMFAAIAVFIATLGATFLLFVQEAFHDRGPPDKSTDDIIEGLLFLSVFLSVSAIISLGYGGFAGRDLPRRALGISLFTSSQYDDNDAAFYMDEAPGKLEKLLSPTEINREGIKRSAVMLRIALLPLFYSIACLLGGFLVFIWAEKSLSISILVTTSLLFFAVHFLATQMTTRT